MSAAPVPDASDPSAAGDGADGRDLVPYVLDEQIGYLMRLASQRHAAIFQDRMAEGLTPTQFAVLNRLADAGPTSQNHLGRRAGLDVATIKGVVDRLCAKGLVVSAPDKTDARLRIVSVTPRGHALVPELRRLGHAITEATLEPLTAGERETLVRLMKKLG